MEDIDKCILCRQTLNKPFCSNYVRVNLDKYNYSCAKCLHISITSSTSSPSSSSDEEVSSETVEDQSAKPKINTASCLLECGHVGYCVECMKEYNNKLIDCHRCKNKVAVLCKIYA
jgi:hypothetical protein